MFRLFRDIRYIFNCTCIAAGAIIAIFINSGGIEMFLLGLLAIIVICIALSIAASFWANRRIDRINHMRENCDISAYISAYEQLYNQDFSRNNSLRQFVTINLAAGYLAIDGGHEKARTILTLLKDGFDQKDSSRLNYLYYCNNMAVCCLRENDTDGAAQWLAEMRIRMDEGKYIKAALDLAERVYSRNRAEIRLMKDETDGLEVILQQFLADSSTKLERAASQWRLLRYHLSKGQTAQAKACLEDILEYADGSYYAADARRYMKNENSGEKYETELT